MPGIQIVEVCGVMQKSVQEAHCEYLTAAYTKDTVGMGYFQGQLFLTHGCNVVTNIQNGTYVAVDVDLVEEDLYPIVGSFGCAQLSFNFGRKDFRCSSCWKMMAFLV